VEQFLLLYQSLTPQRHQRLGRRYAAPFNRERGLSRRENVLPPL